MNRTTRPNVLEGELATLKQGLEAYKLKFNEYPPNFDDREDVRRHMRYCFPRWDEANDPLPEKLDPAEALVFWLNGFSKDSQHPVGGNTPDGRLAFFLFEEKRLVDADGDGYPEYEAPYCKQAPYVYFGSAAYKTATYGAIDGKFGIARPYLRDGGAEYVDGNSYQIIAAGQDGKFSTGELPGQFPSGTDYSAADRDNITTFAWQKLGDRIP